jgi:hypothetical protein
MGENLPHNTPNVDVDRRTVSPDISATYGRFLHLLIELLFIW